MCLLLCRDRHRCFHESVQAGRLSPGKELVSLLFMRCVNIFIMFCVIYTFISRLVSGLTFDD